jgi:hypothetical protein
MDRRVGEEKGGMGADRWVSGPLSGWVGGRAGSGQSVLWMGREMVEY